MVNDDLRRNRWSVAFRLILAIPHLIWFYLWGSIMGLLLIVQWFAALFTGRTIEGLHDLFVLFLRYTLHLYAYVFLAADPYPGFLGQPGYPVDLGPLPHTRQSRWSVALRLVLALPPYLLVAALGSGLVTSLGTGLVAGAGPALIVVFLAWFAVVATGRMPSGFRDFTVYTAGYATQVAAYFFLVTDRFPDSDPKTVPLLPRPRHPVRMDNRDELDRHRLMVFFRLILALPHLLWLTLWGLAVVLAAIAAWASGIALGRVPRPLHRFLAAYVRYLVHVYAFATLAGGLFPGFVGRAGSYPLDIEIDPPAPQSRASIGFRWVLAFPAVLVASTMGAVWYVAPVGVWFHALVRGRAPSGLHALLAYTLRYSAQAYAYALLLTDVYPHSGPSEVEGNAPFPLPTGLRPFEEAPELPVHAPSREPVTADELTLTAHAIGAAL